MAKRFLLVAAGLMGLVALLNIVIVDPQRLAADGVPQTWWWSGALLSPLAGSALPPLLAVATVLVTRRLLPSLIIGTASAALLAGGPNVLNATSTFGLTYLWGSLADSFHLAVLLFTTSLIGLVGVATRSGGTQGIVDIIVRRTEGRRGARVGTALMGFAIFFDDYANTAIVGPTMRPLFDRLKISREKLAYIIDSTAAPIAGLAVISTWVGTEVGYMQDAAQSLGVTGSGYALFFSALGFRFYCVFALVLVLVLAYTGRDFGPMLKAEQRAHTTGQVFRPGAQPLSGGSGVTQKVDAPARWYNAGAPILLVLFLIAAAVYLIGAPNGQSFGVFRPAVWREAFIVCSDLADGNFLAYLFTWSSLVGSWAAIALPWAQGILTLKEGAAAWFAGAKSMALAIAVLVLAWALSQGCGDLHTAHYVGAALGGISGAWVPLVVFVVAGLVAFATGTSWGTMAILIPTAAAVAFHAGGETTMIIAMAAVLDGAIFGDHCSPISDTTVLSSICAGCDHIDHVRTQAPYALVGFAAAGFAGYGLVAAYGLPLWLGYLTGFAGVFAFVFGLGRRAV